MEGELTVTQFNERVSTLVTSSDGMCNIALVGEISEFKQSPAGHVYLTLKDESSIVKCTLFRFAASRVRFGLENGLKVIAYGSASYYVKGGSFGFNIETMRPFGKGDLQNALELLTAKLFAEGLFDQERKRAVPRYPVRIGVVTSPKGAVIKDIIDTAARRYPVEIILSPATVQGAYAPQSIVSALALLNRTKVDVVIVGRGGGSAEDLSAFNDESVVRAVAGSGTPVISAVGHATDKTLCDRVADAYAETPTAAAMLATPDKREENRNLDRIKAIMDECLQSVLSGMMHRFSVLDARLSPTNAQSTVKVYGIKLKNAFDRSDSAILRRIMLYRNRFVPTDARLDPARLLERVNNRAMEIDSLSERIDRASVSKLAMKSRDLESLSMKLEGLDPNRILLRGYGFIKDKDGRVVTSVKDLPPGTDISVTMRDGTVKARIKEV